MSIFKIDMDANNVWDAVLKPIIFYSLVLIVIVIGGVYLQDKNVTCPHIGSSLQKETKYDFLAGGCFIKLSNGNWIASDKYNGVSIE